MRSTRPWLDCLLIFCASMGMFTYGLFNRELVEFETRFGVFAQEMLRNGPSFFPTTYNLPYPDYPSLQTFFIYLLSLPFGKLTTITAILPSALAAAMTLVLLFLVVVKHDRVWAYAAVLMTLLTYQFLASARGLTMDTFVMAATLWAFYSVQSTHRIHWHVWLALIMGFAIRGPIGLVIPSAVVGVALWSQHSFKQALQFGIKAIALLTGLMGLLLIAAEHAGGPTFVEDVLRMEIFGRMNDHTQEHAPFDYFTKSFANYALSFEIALLTVVMFTRAIFQAKTPIFQLLRQCILWILVIMIGMSIPNVRKIRYIMPITPALAILASYWWYQTTLEAKKIRVVTKIHYFFFALPLICLVAVAAIEIVTQQKAMHVNIHYLSAYCLLGSLALISAYICTHRPRKYGLEHPLRIMLIGLGTFWTALVFVITPLEVSLNKTKPFVEQMLQHLPNNKNWAFFHASKDGAAIQIILNANPITYPKFIDTIDWQRDQDYWFVTSEKNFAAQNAAFKHRVEIVQAGKLGHRDMIIFQLRSQE